MAVYGAKWVGNLNGGTSPIAKRFMVKAAQTLTRGDWVTVDDGTGKIDIAAADKPLMGVANETVTSNAAGTTKCEVVLALPGTLWIMDTDGTTVQTSVGEWFDVAGATGAQQVTFSSGAATPDANSSQLVLIEYNPQGHGYDADTSVGLFVPGYTYFTANFVE